MKYILIIMLFISCTKEQQTCGIITAKKEGYKTYTFTINNAQVRVGLLQYRTYQVGQIFCK